MNKFQNNIWTILLLIFNYLCFENFHYNFQTSSEQYNEQFKTLKVEKVLTLGLSQSNPFTLNSVEGSFAHVLLSQKISLFNLILLNILSRIINKINKPTRRQ